MKAQYIKYNNYLESLKKLAQEEENKIKNKINLEKNKDIEIIKKKKPHPKVSFFYLYLKKSKHPPPIKHHRNKKGKFNQEGSTIEQLNQGNININDNSISKKNYLKMQKNINNIKLF